PSHPPVAVLVLLAGAAGAGGVARGLGVDAGEGGGAAAAGVGEGGVLAALLHARGRTAGPDLGAGRLEEGILRALDAQLDMGEDARHRLAQMAEHGLEELEGLALVLVQRIALGIGPEIDALAQMVELQEMVLPGLVEQLEEEALLDLAHD